MNPNDQRIAIAEAVGCKPVLVEYWIEKDGGIVMTGERKECEEWLERLPEDSPYKNYKVKPYYKLPDYLNDLNACHEMEKVLTVEQGHDYASKLARYFKDNSVHGTYFLTDFDILHATAAQRCEVFLKTIGKWKESDES